MSKTKHKLCKGIVKAGINNMETVQSITTDLVCDLIKRPFSCRGTSFQKLILNERPMPDLSGILKTRGRKFQLNWYARKDWLCGSQEINGLFCWPCLLFRPANSSTWTRLGYKNVHSFLVDCKKHEKSTVHLNAYKAWRTYNKSQHVDILLSRARSEEVERHNMQVKQNRQMLKTITEAVLYLSKQELPFRGHDESINSLNRGNYRELLESFAKIDPVFEQNLHKGLTGGLGCFTGVSPDTQNDLIKCLDDIIQDRIDTEIGQCTFLSIQVDETTDVSTKEQLSILVRFDVAGEIHERLLAFVDISSNKSAAVISNVVKEVLHKYKSSITNKLIMQTYDGASVMSGHLNGVQAQVRAEYPFAYFTHCAAHKLNLVLCQATASIPNVKVFFANLSAFCVFTSTSSKRKELFRQRSIEIPKPGDTRWYYKSRTVRVIYRKYKDLMDALEGIIENPGGWDDASLQQASGLLQYLNSFQFCFLTCLFYQILEQSAILYDILQNKATDFSYGVRKIKTFEAFLVNMRSDARYDDIYGYVQNVIGQPSSRADSRINYKQLFMEIIDTTVNMLRERFSDFGKFSFLDLVNPSIYTTWDGKIPSKEICALQEMYGALFDVRGLESELTFMYNDKDFNKDSPNELLQYIYQFNLHESLPEIVKLLTLSSIICISSASVERSFSCLRRVKTFLRSTMSQNRLSSLCRISVHKDILKAMEEENVLHDLVAMKFIEKPRRLEFLYK